MAAEPVIEIDTSTVAKPVGRPAWVRIGGTAYEAKCPKDAVLLDLYQDNSQDLSVVLRLFAAMLGTSPAAEVEEMLHSPDHEDVTYVTLYQVVTYLMTDPKGPRWTEAISESMKALGSGQTPTTRKVAAKPAAKKTAAKKTPARRAPARR